MLEVDDMDVVHLGAGSAASGRGGRHWSGEQLLPKILIARRWGEEEHDAVLGHQLGRRIGGGVHPRPKQVAEMETQPAERANRGEDEAGDGSLVERHAGFFIAGLMTREGIERRSILEAQGLDLLA